MMLLMQQGAEMSKYYEALEQLKPCPFCGGKAGLAQIGNAHTKKYVAEVGCLTFGCTVSLRVGSPKGYAAMEWVDNKAIEKWNSRVEPKADTEG